MCIIFCFILCLLISYKINKHRNSARKILNDLPAKILNVTNTKDKLMTHRLHNYNIKRRTLK